MLTNDIKVYKRTENLYIGRMVYRLRQFLKLTLKFKLQIANRLLTTLANYKRGAQYYFIIWWSQVKIVPIYLPAYFC